MQSPFRPDAGEGETALPGLGALERRVMEATWQLGETSVRAVQEAFGSELAYTTIMTTMDRLFRKGLLTRRKQGKAFLYTARVSAGELRGGAARGLIGALLSAHTNQAHPVLSCIVEAVSERDRALLDDLSRLVQQKKRELQGK